MHPKDQLGYIIPTLSSVVERIQPDQLDDPTPCSEFAVYGVLEHMLVLGGSFAYWFRGQEAPELKAPPASDGVPTAEFRKVMDDLLDAVKSPDAMERTIVAPVGEMPGETFARLVALDGVLHGWDLSRATGVRFELPPQVIDEVDAFARAAITPEIRASGAFADEAVAPVDASPIDALAAFSGRSI